MHKYNFAIIFDMDGVIINNSNYHKKAWDEFCKAHSASLTDDERKRYIYGTINKTALEYIFKRKLTGNEIIKYGNEKEEFYRRLYKPDIKPTDNLIDFLKLLKTSYIPIGIATSANKDNVEFVMKNTGIKTFFKEIIDADQIEKGKPDPEIYLKAAKALGFPPEKCIVIEDSVSGIMSGKNANMKVIAITTTHSKQELDAADLIIDNFNELDITKLINLFPAQ